MYAKAKLTKSCDQLKHRGIAMVCGEGKRERVSQGNQQGEKGSSPLVSKKFRALLTGLQQVLEYTLFQPGFIIDMLAPPDNVPTTRSQELWFDFLNRRAITLKNVDDAFSGTTLNDLVNVVVRAVDYEGEWPVIGGIRGETVSASELLEIGKKVRGMCCHNETVFLSWS
jgi:hypothetical protein